MTATPASGRHLIGGDNRIPSLDGLRAISIGLVVIGHIAGSIGAPTILGNVYKYCWVDLASMGVRCFFIISGLLITKLLLEERKKYGEISLGRFFLRRTFRIFPAYFAFLFALLVAETIGTFSLTGRDWTHALTYTVNYHATRPWEIGHLWSLSVEEQFYAIWPAVLVLAGLRRGMIYAALLLALAPVLRIIYLHFVPILEEVNGITFETAADSLAIGCLLAYYRDRLWPQERWRRLVSSSWLVPTMFAIAYLLHARTQLTLLFGATVLNFALALFIERTIRLHDRGISKFLNARPVAFIGVLSYSLYLWQQPFLNRHGSQEFNEFPQNLILALVACVISYYCVERPGLNLRHRVEARLPNRTPVRQASNRSST